MKEGDGQIRTQWTQVSWHHPQVVVMQPDDCTFGGLSSGAFGKQAVDLEEGYPVFLTKYGAFPKGVQRWPEGFLGKNAC